ncbi:MAG: YncE family protein, partial [Mycobacteriaceae bacterium]
NQSSNNVTVIDGATNTTTTVAAGTTPTAVAVNPVTDKIYVANKGSKNVTVIDGATNTTTTVTAGFTPYAVAVNPVTDKIYVANYGIGTVTVIDGATNTTSTVTTGFTPSGVAANPVTDKIYVTNNGSDTVTVIDGATNTTTTVTAGTTPWAVAVNPVTNEVYVTNLDSNTVMVLTEQVVHNLPLQVAIAPLPGNSTSSGTPKFDLTATTTFTPSAPAIQGVAYQVDTWQGPWRTATATSGGHFTATTPTLQPGVHILYAYATDTQAATSTNTGGQSSPLIGNIASYLFVVTPPSAPAAPVFTAASPPITATVGADYSYLFTATGTPDPTFEVSSGALPSGLSLDTTSGVLSGIPTTATGPSMLAVTTATPTASTTGGSPFTVTASNGVGSDAISLTITITVNPAPASLVTAVSGNNQSAAAETPFATPLTVRVTDGSGSPVPNAVVTFSITTGAATFTGNTTTATATTNPQGEAASPVLTAGTTPGPIVITARTGTATRAVFTETASGPGNADLLVNLGGPLFAGRNLPITFTVTVTNHGSVAAGPTRTTMYIPAGYAISNNDGATVIGGGSNPMFTTLLFTTPALAVGQAITYTVTMTTPPGFSAALIAAYAVSDTPDPDLFDNIALVPTFSN